MKSERHMGMKYIASEEFATRFVMPFLAWVSAFGAQIIFLSFLVWAGSRVIANDSPYEVASMFLILIVMTPIWAWISVCMWVSRGE